MSVYGFLLPILLLFSTLAFADDPDFYNCNIPGVSSISIKVYPELPHSPKFDFKYQIVGNLNPDEFVIINLPGGPGGSSIDNYSITEIKNSAINVGLPAEIPWIMIDPRTVGCNMGTRSIFPNNSLTSHYLAMDVVALIKKLKLKKYIIHGHSYGSLSATHVAHLAPKNGVPAPHALLLSGILGRGKEDGTYSIPFQLNLEWELMKLTLNQNALSILAEENPLGASNENWARYLESGLYRGYFNYRGAWRNPLLEYVQLLNSNNPADLQKLKEKVEQPFLPKPQGHIGHFSGRLFNKVNCHEYSPADGSVVFENGYLLFNDAEDPCERENFDRPYDSAKLLTTSPIYYFAGDHDPAAPFEGAVYHFEHQINARRNFVKLAGGGHNRLGLIFPDCKDKIWKAILELKDLDQVLPKCAVSSELTILPKN